MLPELRTYGGTPDFDWMPDNRRVVLSLQTAPDAAVQLWMADTCRASVTRSRAGRAAAAVPRCRRTGSGCSWPNDVGDYDIVSVDLATAVPRKLIATARNESDARVGGEAAGVVYVSDRNGPNEIWLHRPDNPDRPIVDSPRFSDGTTQWFAAPTLSPDASRTSSTRGSERGRQPRIWISSVAGGTPIRLTNEDAAEYTGSWSPDGAWFVYCSVRDGKVDLKKVKTTGQATPIMLKRDVTDANVPSWSPDGNWIAVGSSLVSPDGQTVKALGDHRSATLHVFRGR